jgi:hypothetical protein
MKFFNFRAGCIAALAFSVIVANGVYQAFYGRVPNDSGMITAIIAHPTYLLLTPFYESLRGFLADSLHRPVDDRFAMEFDAISGWLMGCLQYGAVAALVWGRRRPASP